MKMKILCTLFVTRIVPARQKKSDICDFVTVEGKPVM